MAFTATMTDAQVRKLPVEELAEALRAAAGPEDNARRGAMHAFLGYGDLSLLRPTYMRRYVVAAGSDGPLVQWDRIARHLGDVEAPEYDPTHLADDDPRRNLSTLSGSALDALRLAVALGSGSFRVNLRGACSRFGNVNRVTMAEAIAIAFGIRGALAVPGGHAEPGA